MPSSRSKRELSKAQACKSLEVGQKTTSFVADLYSDITSLPIIGEAVGVVTAGVSLVSHVASDSMDIAQTAMDCSDVPFDEIKEILSKGYNKEDRKLDKTTAALNEVRELASETLKKSEKLRREMHEDFKRILEAIKSSKVEDVITKINDFVQYFVDEKERIVGLPKRDYVTKLEQDDFFKFVSDSRTLKADSLRTFLFEIIEENLAIPTDEDDVIALQALFALYYGTQTYVSVMFFLVKAYSYLADYYYQKGNLEKYNQYFDDTVMTFHDFRHSLIGSGRHSHKPLLDNVMQVLETVKNKDFVQIKQVYSDRIDALTELKESLKDRKLPVILDKLNDAITISFKEPYIATPVGEWETGSEVRYAIQLVSGKNYSKVSDWTNYFEIQVQACPFLKLPAEPKRRTRLIFRQINESKPELIGVVGPDQREFRDTNRDLYNSAGGIDEEIAINEVRNLLAVGASVTTAFEKERTAIHAAARQGNWRIVDQLLQSNGNININAKDNDGYTPLHIASKYGETDFVKKLLEKNADVNAKSDPQQLTPLHLAARNGFEDTVKKLMESPSINVNQKDRSEYTPAHGSVMGGVKIVNLFINNPKADLKVKSKFGLTPLHLATINNDKGVVDALIASKKVDVNAVDVNGMTPLHFAALMGKLNVAQSLLASADVNAQIERSKWTPLHFAIFLKKTNVALALLSAKNIDVNKRASDNVTPLHLAVANGLTDIVSTILSKKVIFEQQTNNGYRPLHVAALRKEENIALLLIEKGADISAKTRDESTPLHLAASEGRLQVVKKLVEKGSNVNAKTIEANTPLHLAAKGGHLEVINFLIDNGGDVYIKNDKNLLFFNVLIQNGHFGAVKHIIEERKIDENKIDARETSFFTVIYWAVCDAIQYGKMDIVMYLIGNLNKATCKPVSTAAYYGQMDILKYLVEEKHMDINMSGDASQAPLIAATESGNLEAVKYLVRKGANVDVKYRDIPCIRFAILKNHLNIVKYLAENGADVNVKDKKSNTLLHMSLKRLPILKYLLLAKNLGINAKNSDGNTILHLAAQEDDDPTVEFLCKMGADVKIKNNKNQSPYDLAFSTPKGSHNDCLRTNKARRDTEAIFGRNINISSDKFIESNPDIFGEFHSNEKPAGNNFAQTLKSHSGGISTPVENMSRSKSSGTPIIETMNVNGVLLLLDVLLRKYTGQKYNSNIDGPVSNADAQVAALNITTKFEDLLSTLSSVSPGEHIDLTEVHRDIFKAIKSGNQSKISEILCSHVKTLSRLEAQDVEKLLASVLLTDPLFSQSIGQISNEQLPVLLSQVCPGPDGVDPTISRLN